MHTSQCTAIPPSSQLEVLTSQDHLDPYEDKESEQVLPFQRTGDCMNWNPILQTYHIHPDPYPPPPVISGIISDIPLFASRTLPRS